MKGKNIAEENGFGIGCTVNPTTAFQKGAEFGAQIKAQLKSQIKEVNE